MKPLHRTRQRPAAINTFAAILLIIAVWNLLTTLLDLPAQQEVLNSLGLEWRWNRDWTIVASSAWFTIELIPIALVWLFASRFARGFVVAMALVKAVLVIANLDMVYAFPGKFAGIAISMFAVALLFTRGANEWFANTGLADTEAIDAQQFD